MIKSKVIVVLIPLILAACAHAPQPKQAVEQHGEEKGSVSVAPVNKHEPAYPKLELSSQMLYTFLLADIAAQRGQTGLAAQAYLELAKSTRDMRAVRRAAQLAYDSRHMEETLEAFKLWSEIEPQATMPKQMLATILISGGKLEEARPYLQELLSAEPKNAGRNILQIYPLMVRYADKAATYKFLQALAQPYPDVSEMHWVLSQAANAAGQADEALMEVRKARALRPEWELAVLLEAQLIYPKEPLQALDIAKKYLSVEVDAKEVRLFYARSLVEQKQYQAARVQFKTLLDKQPDNAELAFAIALLSIQMGELEQAEAELKQALNAGKKDSATVHYYLAQLQEAKKDNVRALQEYQLVTQGEYVFESRIRMAYILGKENKLNEAREVLHQTVAKNNQQRAQLVLIEGQMLRDKKNYDQAFKVLNKGLDQLPNHPDLLYEAGMVADKQGKYDVFEKLLRRLIKVAPDNAHAYNALGYSLLERKERLQEAMQLVERAYQLAPDDAAIMDSVGWGYYLTNKLPESLVLLRRAYAAFPDAEISAHLGEVLWKLGQKDEAQKIWQENLQANPDNATLKSVIKRFIP